MTVTSEISRIEYAGNGVTVAFTTPQFLANSHIVAYSVNNTTGAVTNLALTTNYTLTGAGAATGTLTMLVAPATGTTLVIATDVPATQETDYVENDPFPAASHEAALDKLTLLARQMQTKLSRSLQFSDSAVIGSVSLEMPAPVASYAFFWNSDADAIEFRDPGSVELATPADQSVTLAKHANFTAYTVLGRASGSGAPSLLPFTAQAITLASRTTPAEVRSDLELGSAATKSMAQVCPTGAVWMFAKASLQAGWLECDGAAVSRTTYADLFSAIGTVWGAGDGSTTFNLPDLRGEFVRGWDHGRGVDTARALASAQSESVGPHDHDIAMDGDINGVVAFNNANCVSTASQAISGGNTGTAQIANNSGTENRPRNIALMYCIKT